MGLYSDSNVYATGISGSLLCVDGIPKAPPCFAKEDNNMNKIYIVAALLIEEEKATFLVEPEYVIAKSEEAARLSVSRKIDESLDIEKVEIKVKEIL